MTVTRTKASLDLSGVTTFERYLAMEPLRDTVARRPFNPFEGRKSGKLKPKDEAQPHSTTSQGSSCAAATAADAAEAGKGSEDRAASDAAAAAVHGSGETLTMTHFATQWWGERCLCHGISHSMAGTAPQHSTVLPASPGSVTPETINESALAMTTCAACPLKLTLWPRSYHSEVLGPLVCCVLAALGSPKSWLGVGAFSLRVPKQGL